MTGRRIALALALAFGMLVGVATAAETARQILDRRKALDDGERNWTDRQERMKLVITNKTGSERIRELVVYERREPGDERKSIVFFQAPAEVKGTAFLAFTHKGKPADQWLFLPELNRIRQITSRARTESFVGTDLSYQDLDIVSEMVSWTEDDARSNLVREEPIDGVPCFVIELVPQRDDIGYERILLWLGKDDLVPRQLEFYGDEAEPTKRIRQRDIKPAGKIPVATSVLVETPARGSRTAIESTNVKFDDNLEADLFTQRALERGER